MVNGVATSGGMSAAFGGPDDAGLSAAAGAAGMLTGERRGTGGEADPTGAEPPPEVDLSGVDGAAAALTTPRPVTDSLGAAETGGGAGETTGTTDTLADPATTTETSAPGAAPATESGGLTDFPTTLIDGTRAPVGATAAGTTAAGTRGGAGTRTGSGGGAESSGGVVAGNAAPAGTGTAATNGVRSSAAAATAVGGGRGGVVTESAGTLASPGAGTPASGHSAAGESANIGAAGISATGMHEVAAQPVDTGQVGPSGTAGAPGTHTGPPDTTQAASTPTESADPVPSVTGLSRADAPAAAAANGAARTEMGPGGTGVSRPVAESPTPIAESVTSSTATPSLAADRGLASAGPVERDPQTTASTGAPLDRGRPPAATAADDDTGTPGAQAAGTPGGRGSRTSDPAAPVVTDGWRPGPPGLDTHLIDQPAHHTGTSTTDTRGPNAAGAVPDAAGRVPEAPSAGPGSAGQTARPVDDTAGDRGTARTTMEVTGPDPATESGPETQRAPAPRDPSPTDPPRPGPTESTGPRPWTPGFAVDRISALDTAATPSDLDNPSSHDISSGPPAPADNTDAASTRETDHPTREGIGSEPPAHPITSGGGATRDDSDPTTTPRHPSRSPAGPVLKESLNGHGIRAGDNGRVGVNQRTLPPRTADPIDDPAASGLSRPLPDHGQPSLRHTETGASDDTTASTGSGTDSATRHDDRLVDDGVARKPTPMRIPSTVSRQPEQNQATANELPHSEATPHQHAADHSDNADLHPKPLSQENGPSAIESASGAEAHVPDALHATPHTAGPSEVQDLSGGRARSAGMSRPRGLQPNRIPLSELASDVGREVVRLTEDTGDARRYLPTNLDIVRIYRGLTELQKRGSSADIGKRIAQIHLTGSEVRVRGGVNYGLVHRQDRKNIVESSPHEVLWHFSDLNPRWILRNGFVARNINTVHTIREMQVYNIPGTLISTTRSRDRWFRNRRYRFEIAASRNHDPVGVDVDATLGSISGEAEVAFTGRIDPAAVISVYDHERDRTGYWNPGNNDIDWIHGDRQYGRFGSRPSAPVASTSHAPFHPQGQGANAYPGTPPYIGATPPHIAHGSPYGGFQPWGSPSAPSVAHPLPHGGHQPWGHPSPPSLAYPPPHGGHQPTASFPELGSYSPYIPPGYAAGGHDKKKKWWKFWKNK
ncbi:MAG TPA: hypothetical protein VFG87_05980 [Amycolatopsis sp.]|nr:hypothetical protein [Amycolatopsis sp.]